MSALVLIETVEAEGFGGGGVVASAFGDVQVAGVLDGRGDGGADGGQVGGPAAGAAGRGVFAESHVTDMMVGLDGPVLADQAGQVAGGGVGAGQAGDGAGGLAGGPAGGVLPPAGDLDGLAGMREVQVTDVGGLQGAGPGPAVPPLAGGGAGRYLPPGQGPDLCVQQRLVALDDRDVMRFLVRDQPVQVRPHGVEGIGGHHGTSQVQTKIRLTWSGRPAPRLSRMTCSKKTRPDTGLPGIWVRENSACRMEM